ncbi:glycosyltransferase [Clostridium akagii]|uniref:glycosyltransferase n=1 Tax=Clostridium akagii TaxID=91623 RepID=UPI00056AA073|nr:glycosyltransferase [Clostridium akagii]
MKKFIRENKNKLLILCTIISTIIYLVWRITATIPLGLGKASLISGIALLVVEIIGMFEAAIHFYNMSNIEYPKRPEVSEELFPEVDIFVATYNEPVKLLYKTINGCINMDYPDKKKVHIYICDDGDRPEMKQLAKHMKINYITRSERKGSKAGNLNNAIANSKSPLIATFDADMIPMHGFLMECVPYFLTEEKVGFIQTPQSFYNPDLFQFNLFSENRIPNEQDYFYRDIQVSRNKSNSVIYGGTNTMILREAIKDIGGFYTKAITEDFATGIEIQSKGYKCYAIDKVLASGLSPADLKSLIKQRERWARGCIQTGRRLNILFKKGLNLKQKLSYMSAISYWYSGIKRLIYIISPILFAVFGVVVVKCTILQVIIFWLPMYLLNDASLKLLSKNIRTTKWTNIYDTILFPSLIPPVILETLGISQNKFLVTKKDGAVNDTKYQIKKAIPHIILGILSLIGIVNCFKLTFNKGSLTYLILLFWLVANLYNVLMAIFFMIGRKPHRSSERSLVDAKCSISYDDKKLEGVVYDLSEGGVAIILDKSENIPAEKLVDIKISTEMYSCGFEAEIIYLEQLKGKSKYAFQLMRIEENDYRQLLCIIYDRISGLPKVIDKNSSIFDDLRENILTRSKKKFVYNRKRARYQLRKKIDSKECGEVVLMNFDYQYALIKTYHKYSQLNKITIHICEGINIKCTLKKKLNDEIQNRRSKPVNLLDESVQLYSVDNYEEISENEEVKKIILNWSDEYKKNQNSKKKEPSDEFNEMAYL